MTGSPSLLRGLVDRLHTTLRPVLPTEVPINIRHAKDVALDSWRGMALFSQTAEFAKIGVTREEYDEYGGEIIKRWWGGNWNGGVII